MTEDEIAAASIGEADPASRPGGSAPPQGSEESAAAVQPEGGAAQLPPVQISCSRNFPDWLRRHDVSLAFTSYQTGRLYLVGVNGQGQTAFHERFLARAMGLWADPQRLVVSTLFQVWRFENVLSGPAAPMRRTATTCHASPTRRATSTSTTSA